MIEEQFTFRLTDEHMARAKAAGMTPADYLKSIIPASTPDEMAEALKEAKRRKHSIDWFAAETAALAWASGWGDDAPASPMAKELALAYCALKLKYLTRAEKGESA